MGLADPVITAVRGGGRTQSGVATNMPDEQEVRGNTLWRLSHCGVHQNAFWLSPHYMYTDVCCCRFADHFNMRTTFPAVLFQ